MNTQDITTRMAGDMVEAYKRRLDAAQDKFISMAAAIDERDAVIRRLEHDIRNLRIENEELRESRRREAAG